MNLYNLLYAQTIKAGDVHSPKCGPKDTIIKVKNDLQKRLHTVK